MQSDYPTAADRAMMQGGYHPTAADSVVNVERGCGSPENGALFTGTGTLYM